VIAVLPVALTFLAATFVGAMFARSFKELTFVTVGVSVLLTTYAFVPSDLHERHARGALVSPLTLVVFDLQGEAVSVGEVLFSTGPMTIGAALLFGLGLGVYREEDMFTQKPVGRKFLDALAVRLSAVGGRTGAAGRCEPGFARSRRSRSSRPVRSPSCSSRSCWPSRCSSRCR